MMADETPAPLSDADIAGIAERAAYVGSDVWEISEGFNGRIGSIGPIEGYDGDALGLREGSRTADFVAHAPADIARLLATLAARDVEIERLKSQVTIHETWRQDAEFRLISEHEHHMREYAEDSATLAAYREIVAAVAGYDATYCGIEIGHECALNAQQRARTGGQDFGCHWNKFEDDRTRHMFVHGENCPVTRARALLADTQTPGQESE